MLELEYRKAKPLMIRILYLSALPWITSAYVSVRGIIFNLVDNFVNLFKMDL